MEFRTVVRTKPSPFRITHNEPVMFIGSCFSIEIGNKMKEGHLSVMVNPYGTVYNPVSVCNTLEKITSGKEFTSEDLHHHNGRWFSFSHYTDFSASTPGEVLEKVNRKNEEASDFLSNAAYLFVTFGTARVYKLKKSGKIVSNCHKMPAANFTNELLTVSEIVALWNDCLAQLKTISPQLKVIFTVSPVRHLKDGAHENQISKSVLFLAIEELLRHPSKPGYFPAYEIVMDDLRDYRFYDDDMLHPSGRAIDYIWSAFMDSYFDEATVKLWTEAEAITRAMSHRVRHDKSAELSVFAEKMLSRIDKIESQNSFLKLEKERTYFVDLLKSSKGY
ncbi:MAG: GSCFA domain-containing protein [Bacteroidales bacterium]|nr:GSCFA domain-containing protein [Bacteroidales bacterium]MBN2634432.1 GSCFA domain-containing protein [Bacteroidales bacterium]